MKKHTSDEYNKYVREQINELKEKALIKARIPNLLNLIQEHQMDSKDKLSECLDQEILRKKFLSKRARVQKIIKVQKDNKLPLTDQNKAEIEQLKKEKDLIKEEL